MLFDNLLKGMNMSDTVFIICPLCKFRMGPLARYCSECGTRLPAPKNPPDLGKQIEHDLQVCSERTHEIMKFIFGVPHCSVCGKKL